ncbi:ABC transporter permease subunit [Bacillus lacus]|uniref:ABC transporter permease subunit n=1 Tax=Metabacillus lacus TaxID=1983721 RepID=A0A7X2IWL7_9BACI|nr:ABC transporter permease subunit [Metabacillus lacus]MRX71162.1 ABC transporter permease subunit [Metabacillus lacus]
MIKKLVRSPLFMTGFFILFLILSASLVFTLFNGETIRQQNYLYDESGKLLEASPISPKWYMPFGTDLFGYDMFSKILMGAKYTIPFVLGVALLRMIVSIPLGLAVGSYFSGIRKQLNSLTDSFHYVPLSLIAIYLLSPVLIMPPEGFSTSMWERIFYQAAVLTLLTVPILSTLIGNETAKVLKEEYIMSAKTLGASQWRLMWRHAVPVMREKFFILYGQQVIQVLILLMHLGLFHLFLGGTLISFGMQADPPRSLSNEWSGLIGDSFRRLFTAPWIPLAPILFFGLTILAVSLMIEGYTRVSLRETYFLKRKKAVKKAGVPVSAMENSPEDFRFYKDTSI